MAYKNEVTQDQLDGFLRNLVEQIKQSIADGFRLPWQEPFFVGYLASLVNAQDKTDFSGAPCPAGRPYTGLVNPLFLLYGAERARKRNGNKKMDPRFIRRSSLVCKPQYAIHKDAYVKGLEPVKERIPYNEYVERIKRVMAEKAIPVFFPIKFKRENPDFNPSKPEGKNNPKEIWLSSGKFGMGEVVNVADTNLVEIGVLPPLDETTEKDNPTLEILERTVCGYPQDYEEAECIPHYNLRTKKIMTPGLRHAKSATAYYSTRCHELAHQLQDMIDGCKGGWDRESYSQQELEAEMAAAYVLGTLGFVTEESDEFKNSASYVQGWLEKLENDPQMLFDAAHKAKRLGDFILKGTLPAVIREREKFTFLPAEGNTEIESEEQSA